MTSLPVNELLITLEDGANQADVKAALTDLLPGAAVIEVNTNSGTATAHNFVRMFKSMSYLFPVLSYAVAIMIVVSTLTRMVENQRIQMGTLKALGFPAKTIRNHYLAYALVPSMVGSVAGLIAAQFTLPDAIWAMLMHNSRMPWMLRAPISPVSWVACAATVVLSVLVCWIVYRKAARETTAELLRPKPPKSGSRILLERWKGLWQRLSFNGKMVIRNIFRNKGRSFLSLVGVFFCNMLIVCSFSLQDSIPQMIADHYTKTLVYDVRAELDTTADTLHSYRVRIPAAAVEGIMEKGVSAMGKSGIRSCTLTVVPAGQTSLHLGENQSVLQLPESGACISRKLGKLLDIGLGDTLTVYFTGDDEPVRLPVVCFAETNIGQGIYMSETAYKALRKGGFAPTALLISGIDENTVHVLEEMDEVTDLKYPENQRRQTAGIMDSTTLIFSILSGVALLLAFIICYNMGLMNFTERTRDYATLKVLGYHQKEIRRLMMREQEIISLIATALSVYPGMLLTSIILKLCEMENMVFTTCFKPLSIIKACVISIVFAWAIEWLLTRKVKKIDMVEALKSVE
ncbi:MAG: ABC transporter permease [Clostridia bacterium]|nr:ABC transporter permease [Clostridia bacterium]